MNKKDIYHNLSSYGVNILPSLQARLLKWFLPIVSIAIAVSLLETELLPYTLVANVAFSLLILFYFFVLYRINKKCLVKGSESLSQQSLQQISFTLQPENICIMYFFPQQVNVQLSKKSRASFLGIWLYFDALEDASQDANKTSFNDKEKKLSSPLFIFRDSLSKQSFSRISRTLKML